MSVVVDLPVSMLNLSLVSRTSSPSPIIGRSKKTRCPLRDSHSPCRSPPPVSQTETCPLPPCFSSSLHSSDLVFPHFQPPSCHDALCQKRVISLGDDLQPENSGKARTMFPTDLAANLVDPEGVLLIDCRSFIAFNLNHIKGALNISCTDRMTKKRLQCNKVKAGDLVGPGQEAKDEFAEKRSSSSTIFVLYDDDTEDLSKSPLNSPLQLVLHSLHRVGVEAVFLKGGISAFQSRYSHMCAKPKRKLEKMPLFSPTTPHIHSDIDTATVSEILPFLYLGNERDAADRERLSELGITHVLNVTSHLPLFFEGEVDLNYRRLSASDSAHQNLMQYFQRACDFIDCARQQNGKVMIHCQAGVSRSSTLVIAYIMMHSSLSMSAAFHFVKCKRSIIAPNFNFMGQLMDFEQQLNQGKIERDLALKLNLNEAS